MYCHTQAGFVFHPSCIGSGGSGYSILLPTLALSGRARSTVPEGVFARRIIDDLIDSKAKDLRGTAEQAGLNLYRGAEFNDDLSFSAFRVPKNEMPSGIG